MKDKESAEYVDEPVSIKGHPVARDEEINKKFSQADKAIDRREHLKKSMAAFQNFGDMAETFYTHQPVYYDKGKLWWLWDWEEKKWAIIDETDLLITIADHTTKRFIKTNQKNTIIEALRQVGRRNKPRPIKKDWVQLKNKIVDVNTGEEILPSYDFFSINPIPWGAGESTVTPTLDKLFEEWVGEDNVQTLYEILAYCMLPDYPIHRMFILNGTGRNGKSTFLKILTKFIGDENITTTELDDFIRNSFERASLYKKLVCVMGETNYSELKNTGVIKRLTGEDKMKFEFKGKDALEGYNYAKIIIATNNIPITYDESDGFFRRMLIIDFPNQFEGNRDIMKEIPDEEFNNLANRCVCVLKDLLKKRCFHNEGSIEDRRRRYIERSNELAKFIREKVKEEFGVHIVKEDFRQEFLDWLKANGLQPWSDRRVGGYMNRSYVEKQMTVNGDIKRVYTGITWK